MSASCSESRQADAPQADVPRTVLLTRSATQGAAFARALAEESAQNGLGECRVLFAPLQQTRTVEPGEDHAAALEALASGHYAWVSFTSANTVRACAELWGDKFARLRERWSVYRLRGYGNRPCRTRPARAGCRFSAAGAERRGNARGVRAARS